jgi:hypothetical protein
VTYRWRRKRREISFIKDKDERGIPLQLCEGGFIYWPVNLIHPVK